MIEHWKRNTIVSLVVLVTAASSGCMAGRGVLATRQPFNEAVQHTAKQELLLNIVRLKYREPPEFMALSSINESISYSGNGGWSFSPFGLLGWNFGASTSESPNFTFSPLESDEFNRRLINPIPKDVIDLLGATNWSPGHLLRLTIKNINNVDNASNAGGPTPDYAPEFEQFKYGMKILDEMRKQRLVEMTHVSDEDQSKGYDEKEKLVNPNKPGASVAGLDDSQVAEMIQAAFKSQQQDGNVQTERPTWVQELTPLLRNLTASDVELRLNNMTDAEKLELLGSDNADLINILGEMKNKKFADPDKVKKLESALEKALVARHVDDVPFATKLTKQIRDGLEPEEEEGFGSDQVVLRFAGDVVDGEEVRSFREIFSLVEASKDHPFYNVRRADWGQLRRRDKRSNHELESQLWASPRSFLEMMYFVSHAVCVPQEHIEKGLVTVTRDHDGNVFDWTRVTGDLLNVCVSKRKPKNAATAVQYRGHWYYIRDNDLKSKSTFSLMTQTYNMAVLSGAVGMVPQLTITR